MLVSDLIEETRRLLFSGSREERNKLSAAVTNVATTLPITYPSKSIQRGAKLSIDLEDTYVWDISSLNATPVDRGQFGSTAAAHVISSIIHVNPKFSNWEIFSAINDEINSLSSPQNGLYYIATTELTYNPVIAGYNFASPTVMDIYSVMYTTPGPTLEWFESQDWELSRSMGDNFASGVSITIRDAFPNQSVIVKGKFGFTELAAAMTTNISTSNLPVTAYDILSIGAAWRLTSGREVRRNFDEVQGDTRRAAEVPPGANLGGARELGRLRDTRIREEASRLSQLYPSRSPRYPFVVGG